MFAAALNSSGSNRGKEFLLAKLKQKKGGKNEVLTQIEPVKDLHEEKDERKEEDNKEEKSESDESSSEESSEEEVDEEDEEMKEEAELKKDEASDLNLLKRKRSENEEPEESETANGPHSSIISRFKQTMSLQPQLESAGYTTKEDEINPLADVVINEVKPLPQPALPKDQKLYSQAIKNKNLDWLTKPAYYDTHTTKSFAEFKPSIHEDILKNLKKEFSIEEAFSVQVTLIQELLKDIKRQILDPMPRGDYLVNAATGSGKTLAYLIPIIQSILTRRHAKDLGLKCIVMVPTKPLVTQVYGDALKLTKGTDINVRALRGDMSILEERTKLNQGIDIIITTPGRLMEHLEYLELSSLRFLVVDEADKLLNQSFQNWCDSLIDKIDSYNNTDLDQVFKIKCTKIVLSATLTTSSEKLTHLRLFRPRIVVVNDNDGLVNELYQLPQGLDEFVIKKNDSMSFYKPLLLIQFMILNSNWNDHGLVFTKSNESAIRLGRLLSNMAVQLNCSIDIMYISSHMKPNERQRILRQFESTGGVLVSTDLLSRGMNFNSIEFVINYDLPMSTKEYVHRIGRTARGGQAGRALNLCFGDGEYKWFKRIVYSGGVINRNKKEIQALDIEIELNDYLKSLYQNCLDTLQSEVQKS